MSHIRRFIESKSGFRFDDVDVVYETDYDATENKVISEKLETLKAFYNMFLRRPDAPDDSSRVHVEGSLLVFRHSVPSDDDTRFVFLFAPSLVVYEGELKTSEQDSRDFIRMYATNVPMALMPQPRIKQELSPRVYEEMVDAVMEHVSPAVNDPYIEISAVADLILAQTRSEEMLEEMFELSGWDTMTYTTAADALFSRPVLRVSNTTEVSENHPTVWTKDKLEKGKAFFG